MKNWEKIECAFDTGGRIRLEDFAWLKELFEDVPGLKLLGFWVRGGPDDAIENASGLWLVPGERLGMVVERFVEHHPLPLTLCFFNRAESDVGMGSWGPGGSASWGEGQPANDILSPES
jgi:hypothetical protein